MSAHELVADLAVLEHCMAAKARIVVENSTIVAVDCSPAGADAVRLQGTLLPGLIDLQVNGAGGACCSEPDKNAFDAVAEAVWQGGAAAFLPTLITAPWDDLLTQTRACAQQIAAQGDAGARALGMHVEGPFLEVPGAHDPSAIVAPTRARIDELLDAAQGRLKLLTLASSAAGAAEATAQLTAAGVAVAIGHVADTKGFAACVEAGAVMATHLFNVMGPLHHRNPGIAGLCLDEDRLACGLIADGAHVHPAMVRLAHARLGAGRTVLVTDCMAAMGMPDGEFHLSGQKVRAENGIVRDAHGNLAGSAISMAQAVRRFLDMVGRAGPFTAAQVASANPARLLRDAARGAIAVGRRAEFALLQDDGSLTALRY